MKRIVMLMTVILLIVILLSGCAMAPTPVGMGGLYTSAKFGNGSYWQNDVSSHKVGEASCSNVLGILVTGDASIQAAMENGGIKKVHHIDYKSSSIPGLFSTHTIIVYGE